MSRRPLRGLRSLSIVGLVLLQLFQLVTVGESTPDDAQLFGKGSDVTVVISHGLPEATHISMTPLESPGGAPGAPTTYSLPGKPASPAVTEEPPATQPPATQQPPPVAAPSPEPPAVEAASPEPTTEESPAPSPSPSPAPAPAPAPAPSPSPAPAPASSGTANPPLGPAFAVKPAPPPSGGTGNPPLGPAFAVKPAAPAPVGGTTNPPLGPAFAPKPAGPAATQGTEGPAAGAEDAAPPPFIFKQPVATKTVVFGCALPFTGDQRDIAVAVHYALQMAITENPIAYTNVNLTCLDSKCTDIPAYNAVNRLIADGAVGIIGEICSGASVAAAGVATSKAVPLISPSASATTLSQVDYFFRTVPSDRWQGAAIANEMYDNGLRQTALVYSDSTYGYGLAFNFIASYTKRGGSVPLVVVLKASETSAEEAVNKVKEAAAAKKIDSIFVSTSSISWAAVFLKDLAAAGITLPVIGGDGLADASLITAMQGNTAPLARLTAAGFSPGLSGFRVKFNKFTNGSTYHVAAAHAYDAMKALIKAYEAAAPPKDGTTILAQLQKTKFDGMSGPVEFNEFGDRLPSDKSYVINKFDLTSGKLVYGDPIELHLTANSTR